MLPRRCLPVCRVLTTIFARRLPTNSVTSWA